MSTRQAIVPMAQALGEPASFPMTKLGKLIRYNPKRLFAANEQGVWYDPNDLSTLFQDSAGTIPVTATGQPVGLMLDKRMGLARLEERVSNGDFSDGLTGWSAGVAGTLGVLIGGGVFIERNADSTVNTGIASAPGTAQAGVIYEVKFEIISGSGSLLVNEVSTIAATPGNKRIILKNTRDRAFELRCFAGGSAIVNSISARELPGNHAFQSSAQSRPTLRQTPVLGTELVPNGTFDSDTTGWTAAGSTLSVVSGRLRVTSTGAAFSGRAQTTLATEVGKVYRLEFNGLGGTTGPYFRLGTTAGGSDIINAAGLGFKSISFTALSSTTHLSLLTSSVSGEYVDFDDVTVKEITGYYTDKNYLETDGVDDWMQTNPIDFTGTDKVSIFAGVRKLSDATLGMLLEFSNSFGVNAGAFGVTAPAGASPTYYAGVSQAAGIFRTATVSGFAAPRSDVLTATVVSSATTDASRVSLRVNGAMPVPTYGGLIGAAAASFGNYPLYLFRRAGTSLPFNGHFYGLIILGRLATAAETRSVEKFLAKPAGVTLQ